MRLIATSIVTLALASLAHAAETYKAAVLKEPPPTTVAPELRAALGDQGVRIVDGQGKNFADFWLRKEIPAKEKPAGPKGAVQFPFLADGEFIGVCRLAAEIHDYRDQAIAAGLYTMRFGLQPVNGDHLGVSTYRDYALLLPAAKDRALALPTHKQLEERSAESAGTSHPACLLLLTAKADASRTAPVMIQDSENETWSVVLPLTLKVKAPNEPLAHPVSLVVVGTGPA
jgi:hypothetical protein